MSIWFFLFGLVIGSFLNAVIHRLRSGQSISSDYSRCPHCSHKLAFLDLVPLVSFFVLRGKCRYCGKKISWQYPLVELVTALAFVIIYYNFVSTSPLAPPQAWGGIKGGVELLFFRFALASFLIIIFVYDLKHYLVLDKVVWPAAGLAFIYQGYHGNLSNAILGAALLSGFFVILYFVSHGHWIGAGDIKLGIFLGALVPFPQTLALFLLAYILGAGVALVLLAAKRKKMADRLPFGTFLTMAAFIAMLWGEEIISWYFKLLGL